MIDKVALAPGDMTKTVPKLPIQFDGYSYILLLGSMTLAYLKDGNTVASSRYGLYKWDNLIVLHKKDELIALINDGKPYVYDVKKTKLHTYKIYHDQKYEWDSKIILPETGSYVKIYDNIAVINKQKRDTGYIDDIEYIENSLQTLEQEKRKCVIL